MNLRQIQMKPSGTGLYVTGLFIAGTLLFSSWLARRAGVPELGWPILILGIPGLVAALLGYRLAHRARERGIAARPPDFPAWLREVATGDWVGPFQARVHPNRVELSHRRLNLTNALALLLLLPAGPICGEMLHAAADAALGVHLNHDFTSLAGLLVCLAALLAWSERRTRRVLFAIDRDRNTVQTSRVGPYAAAEHTFDSIRGLFLEDSPSWMGPRVVLQQLMSRGGVYASPTLLLSGDGALTAPICGPMEPAAAKKVAEWIAARLGAPILAETKDGNLPEARPLPASSNPRPSTVSGVSAFGGDAAAWRPLAVERDSRPSRFDWSAFRNPVPVLAGLVTVVLLAHAAWLVSSQLATSDFLPAEAVLGECRVDRQGRVSELRVQYSYVTTREAPPNVGSVITKSMGPFRKHDFAARWPPGTRFTAYYNPLDHHDAVMFRGEEGLQPSERARLHSLAVLAGLALAGVAVQLYSRSRSNRAGGWEVVTKDAALGLREPRAAGVGRVLLHGNLVTAVLVAWFGLAVDKPLALYAMLGVAGLLEWLSLIIAETSRSLDITIDRARGVAEFRNARGRPVPLSDIQEVRTEARGSRAVAILSINGAEQALSIAPSSWSATDRLKAAAYLARVLGVPFRAV